MSPMSRSFGDLELVTKEDRSFRVLAFGRNVAHPVETSVVAAVGRWEVDHPTTELRNLRKSQSNRRHAWEAGRKESFVPELRNLTSPSEATPLPETLVLLR